MSRHRRSRRYRAASFWAAATLLLAVCTDGTDSVLDREGTPATAPDGGTDAYECGPIVDRRTGEDGPVPAPPGAVIITTERTEPRLGGGYPVSYTPIGSDPQPWGETVDDSGAVLGIPVGTYVEIRLRGVWEPVVTSDKDVVEITSVGGRPERGEPQRTCLIAKSPGTSVVTAIDVPSSAPGPASFDPLEVEFKVDS